MLCVPSLNIYAKNATAEDMYLENCLSVTDNTYTKTYGGVYNYNEYYSSFNSNTYQVNDWRVYQGYNEISKVDFFTLTDKEDLLNICLEANEINQNKLNIAKTCLVAGSISALGGLGCMLVPIIKSNYEGPNSTLMWLGVGLLCVGTIGLYVAKFEVESFVTPDIPIQVAIQVANDYNNNLQLSIKRSFK